MSVDCQAVEKHYLCLPKLRHMENQGEIILYQPDNEVKLEVRLENETVWLTQAQMAASFYAISQQIEQFVLNGHSLELGTLGSFYLSTEAKASETEEGAGADAVERFSLKFRQSKRLRDLLTRSITLDSLPDSQTTSSTGGEENEEDSTAGGNSGEDDTNNPLA